MSAAAPPEMPEATDVKQRRFGCEKCGADLQYAPGTTSMKCPYCGSLTHIPQGALDPPSEHDIAELQALAGEEVESLVPSGRSLLCKQCGASTQLTSDKVATRCPFCGSNIVVPQEHTRKLLKPEGVVPFQIDRREAQEKFVKWVSKGFFRPSALKENATVDTLRGTYVPYFTYDAQANSSWTGEAGHYYYTTESYTVTVDGRPQSRTRQVRHVRWTWHSGTHAAFYDDVLICASRGLSGGLMKKIEPFDTHAIVPYTGALLAGFEAEEYSTDPSNGWKQAAQTMLAAERQACSRQLGGDTQRFLSVSTNLSSATFKHLLLPVYVASYQYGGKPWRFLVNGQTGEVQGTAPVSWMKVLLVTALIVGGLWVVGKWAGLF